MQNAVLSLQCVMCSVHCRHVEFDHGDRTVESPILVHKPVMTEPLAIPLGVQSSQVFKTKQKN